MTPTLAPSVMNDWSVKSPIAGSLEGWLVDEHLIELDIPIDVAIGDRLSIPAALTTRAQTVLAKICTFRDETRRRYRFVRAQPDCPLDDPDAPLSCPVALRGRR